MDAVIDMHTHLFPEEVQKNRSPFCRRDENFRLLYENPQARLTSLEDLLNNMDRHGIEKSVICGFPWQDPVLCRAGNDYLLHCHFLYPQRLIPFITFSFASVRLARREIERTLNKGIGGIGEIAFYQGGITAERRQKLTSIMRPFAAQGLPLLLHTNEPVGHTYPGKTLSSLKEIYQLIQALPDQPIILAHWGGGFFFYELMPEVAQVARHVYYDTAASPFLYHPKIYSVAIDILGPNKILFGSDYPLISPARYFAEMTRIGLPARWQEKIKKLNFQKLLIKPKKGE
ncbi:MAG: amidohydrolase family protein [Thermodesulfobacteriota bacterium]